MEKLSEIHVPQGSRDSPVRILHLEDDPADFDLVRTALEAGGIVCQTTPARNRDEFAAALERGGMDLVMSDYRLPNFDGMAALAMARAKCPDLPFILVSGTLGEELAVESLKKGATDYVLKDRLYRLVPAIKRALKEAEERAERRRLEEQFIEAQKMEVVGHLAGGVAHDFNNIIGIILGYSDLLEEKIPASGPAKDALDSIRNAAERAAGLTRQLLVFSRKQKVQPVVLDLRDVVISVEKMLRRLIDENVEFAFVPGRDAGRIKADAGQIGQVLMNLVVNARDAMPRGGKLTVQTGNVTLPEPHARQLSGLPAGEYVMLSVSDTGTGMTEEVEAHIFEAFFTTKPKGKGTGLGLATCQTIVHQSGGQMTVVSELGKGTVFKIYFPRVDLPLAPGIAGHKGPVPRGTETLLVVEDEPAVRGLARNFLESQGYEVLTASNGQDGLRVVREHKGHPIRLVITDVVMPQMGGKVMAEWLKSSFPDLKILFTSGYTDDAIVQHGVLDAGVEFLPKPYAPATLARKVREMLDT
jgi:two-component system, cell cycle sensor histidine kinase and response regulator CckA